MVDMHDHLTDENIQTIFAAHQLRFTRQRCTVYRELTNTTSHPSADEMYHCVCAQHGKNISLATIYNTLEAFCSAGLAQKLADGNGSARFDATVDNHLHLRDSRTGKVADVPNSLSNALLEQLPKEVLHSIEEQLGFTIDRIHVELIGSYQQ